jgi:hypothetical protein
MALHVLFNSLGTILEWKFLPSSLKTEKTQRRMLHLAAAAETVRMLRRTLRIQLLLLSPLHLLRLLNFTVTSNSSLTRSRRVCSNSSGSGSVKRIKRSWEVVCTIAGAPKNGSQRRQMMVTVATTTTTTTMEALVTAVVAIMEARSSQVAGQELYQCSLGRPFVTPAVTGGTADCTVRACEVITCKGGF